MSNKIWPTTNNDQKSIPTFPYIYDQNVVLSGQNPISTGGWRPYTTADIGSINISGGLSVGNVAVTGGLITISNPILAVSGNLSANVTSIAITGNPIVTLTGNQNTNIINSILPVSGILNALITGNINVVPAPSNIVSNSTPSGANGLAITANQSRKTFFIQNISTGNSPLFVRFDGPASIQSYNFILKPSSSLYAGDGGVYQDEDGSYKGNVYVSGLLNVNYISWEMI